MRNLLMRIALWLVTTTAAASENADIIAVAHRWAEAFSRGSFNSDIAPCAEDAVVIDDFPPHVWQGPGACSRWFQAFETWAATTGVTHAAITLGETRHLESNAGAAYLVAPVTLSYMKAGRPVDFAGTITMTLRKQEAHWRVSGVAWTDE